MNADNSPSSSNLLSDFNLLQGQDIPERAEQFLRFHLLPKTTALLPVKQLSEVLEISTHQVVPISHLPSWVMGVYNWRGEILWTIDLGQLLGLPPWYEQARSASTYTLAILSISTAESAEKRLVGMMVHRVEEIEWCSPDSIQSPPSAAVTPELIPFLRGFHLDAQGEMLAVLSGEAILTALS